MAQLVEQLSGEIVRLPVHPGHIPRCLWTTHQNPVLVPSYTSSCPNINFLLGINKVCHYFYLKETPPCITLQFNRHCAKHYHLQEGTNYCRTVALDCISFSLVELISWQLCMLSQISIWTRLYPRISSLWDSVVSKKKKKSINHLKISIGGKIEINLHILQYLLLSSLPFLFFLVIKYFQ